MQRAYARPRSSCETRSDYMGALTEPHGGELKNLYLDEVGARAEKTRSRDLPSWDLSMRQTCDIEMLLNGAFSPLEGFLGEKDYRSVLAKTRLASGVIWPMPITLDVTPAFADKIKEGATIALRDAEGVLIGTMDVSSIYRPDKAAEAKAIFGTTDEQHPGVSYLMRRANEVYLGGKVRGVEAPSHYDFSTYVILLVNFVHVSRSSAGAASSRSRRAIRCTARTRSSRS